MKLISSLLFFVSIVFTVSAKLQLRIKPVVTYKYTTKVSGCFINNFQFQKKILPLIFLIPQQTIIT